MSVFGSPTEGLRWAGGFRTVDGTGIIAARKRGSARPRPIENPLAIDMKSTGAESAQLHGKRASPAIA